MALPSQINYITAALKNQLFIDLVLNVGPIHLIILTGKNTGIHIFINIYESGQNIFPKYFRNNCVFTYDLKRSNIEH